MSMQPDDSRGGASRLLAFVSATVIAGLLAGLVALPIVGGVGVLARDAVEDFERLPDAMDTPPLAQRTEILAADGSTLATLYYQNRVEVPLSSIAPVMRQAIVAIEDSRFLEHNGVDVRGVLRAAARNAGAGGVQQGASTLTMQYVENVLVNAATSPQELESAHAKSAAGKLREMRFALALERRYTKAEILERYLNIVYFGAGAYGVEAAARRYFDKPAADLTLAEAATLAGIVQQPVGFDPLRNPDRAQKRRDVVLARMAEVGFVTPEEAERAKAVSMAQMLSPSVTPNGCTTSYAPYFCDYVLETIRSSPEFGATVDEREAFLRRGGYTIRTTLQPRAQRGATEAVVSTIPIDDPSRRAAAITMIEPGSGNIVAMTQNREWGTAGRGKTTYNYNVDRAMGGTIGMQAGSTFKVFTLAAALEAGISPREYVSSPSSKTFTDFVNCETGASFDPVTVRNSTSSGTFDMSKATAYSVNTYFMAIEERIGLCRAPEIAESMGVFRGNGEPLLRVPSFTLGSMEVTPLAMANAFATFANHGEYCTPRAILEIRDRENRSLPVPPEQCRRVLSRNVADGVAALLTGVIDGWISGRTGGQMALGDQPAAGKTGTTNENAAVWFAGFTPTLAAAAWVGDPRGGFAYPMKDVTINGRYYAQVFGSTMPGPIWKASMEAALANTRPVDFDLVTDLGLQAARTVSGQSQSVIDWRAPRSSSLPQRSTAQPVEPEDTDRPADDAQAEVPSGTADDQAPMG